MGRISNALERELGKNTGKFISNLIFGDSHSTPYRRVDNEHRTTIAESRAEIARRNAEAQRKRQRKDDLNNLNAAVLRNADIVIETTIPQEEKGLIDLLSMWAAQLETTKWRYSTKEGRIHNQYSNALLEKYNQALLTMNYVAPTNPMVAYYQTVFTKAKRKRFFSWLFSLWGLMTVLIITILFFILLKGGNEIDADTLNAGIFILGALLVGVLVLLFEK